MDDRTIQIPIDEYENFRNTIMHQDKQPLIRELQQLLQDKEEDLQRYKEKLDQCNSVLNRTQRQLDKCMQFSKVDRPVRMVIPRSVTSRHIETQQQQPEVVSHSIHTDSSQDRKATEHDETNSMPVGRATPFTIESDSEHLKSVPAGLGMPGLVPGMSAALLRKLVSENLKLRQQLEEVNDGKPIKLLRSDSLMEELKDQLSKKQEQLDEARKHLSLISLDDMTSKTASTRDPSTPSPAHTIHGWLIKKVEKLEKNLDLNRVMISSLTEQKDRLMREKTGLESLVEKYRSYDRRAENRYNEERIAELERELETRKRAQENSSSKLESLQVEFDKQKQSVDLMGQERDLAIQNYNILCQEFTNIGGYPSSYSTSHPGPISPQAFKPALAPPPSSSFGDSALSSSIHQSQYSQPTSRSSSDMSLSTRSSSKYRASVAEPPLPPRLQPHHRPTVFTRSTIPSDSPPPPPPRERRILKCPGCERVFDLLQSYKEHINVCLKT